MTAPFLQAGSAVGNVVLDIDGVVRLGDTAVPGASETIGRLTESGRRVLYATNNATRTTAEVAELLGSILALSVAPDSVITSAVAAAAMIEAADRPSFVVGEGGLIATLQQAGHEVTGDPGEARSVVAGLDRRFDYGTLSAAMSAIRRGARLIATNTDATFPMPGGEVPGAGTIIAALEAAGGVTAEVAGKPHAPMTAAVSDRLGPGPVWVVGDRPETDLAMARSEGWTGVLVLTGVTRDAAAVPARHAPDVVLDSIADVADVVL